MDFSYAYLDFEYTYIKEFEGTPVSTAHATPYTPETKWSIGAQYRFDLGNWGDLTYRLDAAYQDDVETTGMVGQGVVIPAYTLLNGRIVWRSDDLKWQASLEGTNLTDKYYYQTVFDLVDSEGSIFKNAQPGRPQEFAFTIKRTWYFE
jgi:iron complex outermembrane receptor protein